jgi:thiamine-phosphate diphosphorylase
MVLQRIQYITHPQEDFTNLAWVHRLHEGGIRWIQLRIKEDDFYTQFPGKHYLAGFMEIADQLRAITEALGMILTINDHAEIVSFSQADGIHVGMEDQSPKAVIDHIGNEKILGVTANSLTEILSYDLASVNYMGVGPFRKTATKKDTKEVLGYAGYSDLITELKQHEISIPVFAIGGIELDDIEALMQTGIYGIAVSGLIFNQGHQVDFIQEINLEVNKTLSSSQSSGKP